MQTKTVSGVTTTGALVVEGDLKAATETSTKYLDVKEDAVITHLTVTESVDIVQNLTINSIPFRYSVGEFTPIMGWVTRDNYVNGFVPWTDWGAMSINKMKGAYERTGQTVTIYLDIDFIASGQTWLGGGGGLNVGIVGIRGLPYESDSISGISMDSTNDVANASWPNGINATTGLGAPFTPNYPYQYQAILKDKNEIMDLILYNYTPVTGWSTFNYGTHTFNGKEIIFYSNIEGWNTILVPPYIEKASSSQRGLVSGMHFAGTGNYHIKFLLEITYFTNDS